MGSRIARRMFEVSWTSPTRSDLLFPRGKARARAPRSQRQPLQNRGRSSRSRSRKATWHRSRRSSGLLGQTPSPQFWPVLDALSEAKEVQEPKPVREAVSRSPDEVRADAVARVASLEGAIAALGDHDDQARKSLKEALAKAKKSAIVAPCRCEVELVDELRRAPPEEVDNQGRRDFQEGRGASTIAVRTCRGGGKIGRGRSQIGVSQGRGGSGEQRSSSTFCERRELTRFRSREVVGGTKVDEDEGAFSTDLSHTKNSWRLGPGAPSIEGGERSNPSRVVGGS